MINFSKIKQLFRKSRCEESEKESLYQELLLMVLARGGRVDYHISDSEIGKIKDLIARKTDLKVDEKDIRMASMSELYETAPLYEYVADISRKIDSAQKVKIARLLLEVILVDGKVTSSEAEFYNMIVNQLDLTPFQQTGLEIS